MNIFIPPMGEATDLVSLKFTKDTTIGEIEQTLKSAGAETTPHAIGDFVEKALKYLEENADNEA